MGIYNSKEDNVNLTKLEYSDKIRDEIKNLINLRFFDCSNNNLDELPPNIENLINLRELKCEKNKIKSLSKIETLINLDTLYCSHNQIKDITPVCNLLELQYFSCSYNQIKNIPAEIVNLTQLRSLICSNNQIKNLPIELNKLISLKFLYVDYNQLESIELSLHNLTMLSCHNNKISLLKIENCYNLEYLECSDNELTELPNMMNFLRLKFIWCYNNKLTQLSSHIGGLPSLLKIHYHNNPLEYVPHNLVRIGKPHDRWINCFYHNNEKLYPNTIKAIYNIINHKPVIENCIEYIKQDTIFTKQTKNQLFGWLACHVDQPEIIPHRIDIIINISYLELLQHVMSRIEINPHKVAIKKMLNHEMKDDLCESFSWHISRLIYCLNGYDPEVSVPKEEIIEQIITAVWDLLPPDIYIGQHRRLVKEKLTSRKKELSLTHKKIQELSFNN